MAKPFVLVILDGWGYTEHEKHNPIKSTATPTFDYLFETYPHTLLHASGKYVGLPKGQMGNSEVGHLHIGAGRQMPQDLTRIGQAIQNGKFTNIPTFLDAIQKAKQSNNAVHVLGLLSPGGVHSHENHIMTLVKLIADQGVKKNYTHALLDGRDTPPQSALASLKRLEKLYANLSGGQIASIIGRYYAMDRDKRWQRTQVAYDLLTAGKTNFHTNNVTSALQAAYQRGENDEFVKPTAIHDKDNSPITIRDGDVVIFMNFRADRARQLTRAFTEENFSDFQRDSKLNLADFVTLTEYAHDINTNIVFPIIKISNTLGEYLSNLGYHQLRIAETEKYAHVTYFLNGGIEKPFNNEERILIPSPKVATYDLQPEMSAIELTDHLIDAINSEKFNLIVCNYANPDMVGHTGFEKAAQKAVSTIDQCVKRIIESLKKIGGEALITSDHGNIECMYDETTNQPHTAHTNNPVPLIYVGRPAEFLENSGSLYDISPTILYLMGLNKAEEMTGKNLIKINE